MSCNPCSADSWLDWRALPVAAVTVHRRRPFADPIRPGQTGVADGVDTRSKATAVCSTARVMPGVSGPPPTAPARNAREFVLLVRASGDCGAALPGQQAA
jgi:hypothetical protein